MKISSLFLVLFCVLLCAGVLVAADKQKDELGGEDVSIKGADTSFFVDYGGESQGDNESPKSQDPSLLEEKLEMERGFASGVYDNTAKMVEGVSSLLSQSDGYYNPKEQICDAYGACKEKIDQAVDKTKEGLHYVKEAGDAAKDKTKQQFERAESYMDESSSVADLAKEAWTNTKGELEDAKETVTESVPRYGKTMENLKNIGLDIQKVHNTIWDDRSLKTKFNGLFRELSANFSDVAHYAKTEPVMAPAMGVVQLMGLSVSFGVHIWVCFVSSKVLARTVTRLQYVEVQRKIRPIHFLALVGGMISSLLAHCLKTPHISLLSFQVLVTFVSLFFAFFNRYYANPRATRVFFDKMNLERKLREEVGKDKPRTDTAADVSTSEKQQQEVMKCQLQELDRHLKRLKRMAFAVDVATLISLFAQVGHVGKSLNKA